MGQFWWTGESRGPPRDAAIFASWEDFTSLLDRAEERLVVQQGMKWSSQGAEIEVLNSGGSYPDTAKESDIHNDSMVLMLAYHGVRVLLPGDIEASEQADLVSDFCGGAGIGCPALKADIIKAPGHGSSRLSEDFVRSVGAEHVLISAPPAETVSHEPSERTFRIYQRGGAKKFYSTSLEGRNHLRVRIGPAPNEFFIEGATSGFVYWRDVGENEVCNGERLFEFCLEKWDG